MLNAENMNPKNDLAFMRISAKLELKVKHINHKKRSLKSHGSKQYALVFLKLQQWSFKNGNS